ncbi:MAG: hypothetical protein V1779_15440 [bacterium]
MEDSMRFGIIRQIWALFRELMIPGIVICSIIILLSCGEKQEESKQEETMNTLNPTLQERIDLYASVNITADISHLTVNEKKVIELLIEAGKIADEIFWKQTAPSAIPIRDSLIAENTPEARQSLDFVMINYGPYDRIDEGKRYLGSGPDKRPDGGNFYPLDMTKKEFEDFIKANPDKKDEFESQYTIIVRDKENLKAIPYHEAYPEIQKVAEKLEEAAFYADNPTFKAYLIERANAFRTDQYFNSDMMWMDIKNSKIDVIIGPIENYEDAIYNYKTAWEAVVMVKDEKATKELEFFNQHVKDFENRLPYDKKYIRKQVGSGTQINFVNVLFFGGDCQVGTKTIACSLPNDPKVREAKGGGKNSMYKNMMEAKFDKIVVPIAEKLLEPEQAKFTNKKAFMTFVTLHEVSHTLGRGYVFGNDALSVRKALKEKYSAIEECKADILGIYNQKHLFDMGKLTQDDLKKAMATYLPGLYRSIRFGAEEAHGKANLIQLNFLFEKGAISKNSNGKFVINEDIFFDKCAELAKLVLTIEAEGDYKKAAEILKKYGIMKKEIQSAIDLLKGIPRDLNTTFNLNSSQAKNRDKDDDATSDAVHIIQGL